MLVKKTLVVFRSMLSLTHCSMSRNAIPYASSVDTQLTAPSVPALSHGPFLQWNSSMEALHTCTLSNSMEAKQARTRS